MIPTIGLIIATYVILRCVDTLVSMMGGGIRNGLNVGAKVLLVILAIVTLSVALVGGYDLLVSGTRTALPVPGYGR